jgi:FG-GAP repeat
VGVLVGHPGRHVLPVSLAVCVLLLGGGVGNPAARASEHGNASSLLKLQSVVRRVFRQPGLKLTGAGRRGTAEFGTSVAISANGDTALIGGPNDNTAGAAWVFTRSGSTWRRQGKKLTVSRESAGGLFGESVALSANGNTALIGGPSCEQCGRGAAWVFTRSGSIWKQQGKDLTGRGGTPVANFGVSVALSADGDTALIGGVDNNGDVGAAWVYTRSGSNWTQQAKKLTGSGEAGTGGFGSSVALSGDGNTALIGGPFDHDNTGAAWVFTRSRSAWTQQGMKLTGQGESGAGWFGSSVALSGDGDTALVGGPYGDADVDAGAAWLFGRSGSTWHQEGRKLAGSGGTDSFGFSVALSSDGNTALIGGLSRSRMVGAAWVFTRSGSNWHQQGRKLTDSGEIGTANFGACVALSADGNTGLFGGPYDKGNPTSGGAGAAWVFTRSGSGWSRQGRKLTGSGETLSGEPNEFGFSVALSAGGNTALIGDPGDNSIGAAWVFTRSRSGWTEQGKKLIGSGSGQGGAAYFGSSVALSADGNTALIGGPEGNGDHVGAAWVFTRSGSSWRQQGRELTGNGQINEPDEGGEFGSSVALSADGDTAMIGGPGDDGAAGAVWVFERSGSRWTQLGEKLTGSGSMIRGGAGFGSSIAISADDNTALIGGDLGASWVFTRSGAGWAEQDRLNVGGGGVALSADGNTALVGGQFADYFVGAAWVFTRSGSTWSQQGRKLSGGETGHGQFGASAALSADGDIALIGGPLILSRGNDDGVGAAWAFTRSGSTWTQQRRRLIGNRESGLGDFGMSVALSAGGDTALIGGPGGVNSAGAAWVFRT